MLCDCSSLYKYLYFYNFSKLSYLWVYNFWIFLLFWCLLHFFNGLFVLISSLLEALIQLMILDTLEILKRQALKSWLKDGYIGSSSYELRCRLIGQQNHVSFEKLQVSVCFLKLFCFSRDRFSTHLLEGW